MWRISDLISYFFFSVFFCKQKAAYERRSSDGSSDVCSSDLAAQRYGGERIDVEQVPGDLAALGLGGDGAFGGAGSVHLHGAAGFLLERLAIGLRKIGRAWCRASVCLTVYISLDAVALQKNKPYLQISGSSELDIMITL